MELLGLGTSPAIGLHRGPAATRVRIRQQFLTEAVLLATLGGMAGALLGVAVTAVFTLVNGWTLSIPSLVVAAAVVATVIIDGVSGLCPSVRAACTPLTVALNA